MTFPCGMLGKGGGGFPGKDPRVVYAAAAVNGCVYKTISISIHVQACMCIVLVT